VIVKVFGLTQPIGPVGKKESKKKVMPRDTITIGIGKKS